MSIIDWLIVIIPVGIVMWLGWYVRRYIVGISDYLVAGRLAHRYIICSTNIATALGLVTLVAYVEIQYKTGFALQFWNSLLLPLSVMLS